MPTKRLRDLMRLQEKIREAMLAQPPEIQDDLKDLEKKVIAEIKVEMKVV